MSFGVLDVAEWQDGHKSVNIRVDRNLRELPQNASESQQEAFQQFTTYGTFSVRPSDIPNLIHVAALVQPGFKYSYN